MSSRVVPGHGGDESRGSQRGVANDGSAKPEETPASPDVGSDRVVKSKTSKKPLPIDEIEDVEDDAKGG